MIDYECTNPQRRRIEKHREQNEEIWCSEEWKERKAVFLRQNPTCCRCAGDSQVPHHPDIEVYGKPEYLDLSDTRPYCNQCHTGEHTGKFQCPICHKIVSKREGERCYDCLEGSDKQRIKSGKSRRNEAKNKRDRENYRKYHPRKEVRDGKWVTISPKRNGSTSSRT